MMSEREFHRLMIILWRSLGEKFIVEIEMQLGYFEI
jgi:hypothetical protein